VVQAAAYALGVLLRRVCSCTADTPQRYQEWYDSNARSERQGPRQSTWRQLPEEQRHAFEVWGSLSEGTRRAAKPYLLLSAEARASRAGRNLEPSPIFVPGIRYSEWLTRWSKQLLGHVAKLRDSEPAAAADGSTRAVNPQGEGTKGRNSQARRAELLLACEPCVRFDPQLALLLLPYMVLLLLPADPARRGGGGGGGGGARQSNALAGDAMRDLLLEINAVLAHQSAGSAERSSAEGRAAATGGTAGAPVPDGAHTVHSEHSLCCQAIFSVLDTLHDWRTQCCALELEGTLRRLENFVSQLPAMELGRCALGCGAAFRALLIMERHVDRVAPPVANYFLFPKHGSRKLPTDATALVARAYSHTSEPDGLIGLSRMRDATSVEEEVFRLVIYCHYQYCMLNGNTGGAGENHILRIVDFKIQRGEVAIKEVLNAKNNIQTNIL